MKRNKNFIDLLSSGKSENQQIFFVNHHRPLNQVEPSGYERPPKTR